MGLIQGEKYIFIDKSSDWYYVKDKFGNTGYAPANHLEFIQYDKMPTINTDKSHYGKE